MEQGINRYRHNWDIGSEGLKARRLPTTNCEGFVDCNGQTGQTGVLKTWAGRRPEEAVVAIRTIRANVIKARKGKNFHKEAGYTAAILSLPFKTKSLQRGGRPYTSRQTPYFLSRRRQKVSKKRLSPCGGHLLCRISVTSRTCCDGNPALCQRA